MTATKTAPQTRGKPTTTDWGKVIQSTGRGKPSRVILHGVEGVGKTSFGAYAPDPIFLMARGETGLETLIDSGQLSEVPHWPEITTWTDAMSALEWLAQTNKGRTLVIDTLNGLERLCHEHVCQRDYGGVWGKSGFTNYMQGYEVALADWREFLSRLDSIRDSGIGILCLCHTKVTTFKNPEGADYDRYQPDLHHKTWSLSHKWADHVLFANFFVEVVSDGAKGKGKGGQDRVIYTERHAAFDAKNRAGLPETISMGNDGKTAWTNFLAAMQNAKLNRKET